MTTNDGMGVDMDRKLPERLSRRSPLSPKRALVLELRRQHPEWTLDSLARQAGVSRGAAAGYLSRAGLKIGRCGGKVVPQLPPPLDSKVRR